MNGSKHNKSYLVTGGAGFIGSHLVDSLLLDDRCAEVRVVDDFSSGRRSHLAPHSTDRRLKIYERDIVSEKKLAECFDDVDLVYHLAANPDARRGLENTRLDLQLETIATYNVLEAMRISSVTKVVLASSGTVYGDIGTTIVDESYGPCLPVSLYGAGKVASEALLTAFCGTFDFCGVIARFGNIVGERTTHGVIYDLIRKLARDHRELEVLGNGTQAKPYVYVRDLVSALRHLEQRLISYKPGEFDVFNVAPNGATSVRYIAESLVSALGLADVKIHYGNMPFGWPGDVPQSRMDSSKLRASGFQLRRTSDQAVDAALLAIVQWLRDEKTDELRLPAGLP